MEEIIIGILCIAALGTLIVVFFLPFLRSASLLCPIGLTVFIPKSVTGERKEQLMTNPVSFCIFHIVVVNYDEKPTQAN